MKVGKIPREEIVRKSNRLGLVAQLAEHWTSIAGSIPTVVRLTFQLSRCGYTLRVTSKTLYSPECITSKHTQKCQGHLRNRSNIYMA